jgi:hypothetical protein
VRPEAANFGARRRPSTLSVLQSKIRAGIPNSAARVGENDQSPPRDGGSKAWPKGVFPRIQTSEPIIHSGALTFNNISVEGSVVGAINTEELHKLDLAMTDISASGNPMLAGHLQALTQAVVNARDIPDSEKNEHARLVVSATGFFTSV